MLAPVLGAAPVRAQTSGGLEDVERGSEQVARDPDGCRHGDGLRLGGLTHSIRPGVPCPATVLVVSFSNGSFLLVGYPDGEPAALVIAEDARLLRQGFAEAFGHTESNGTPVCGDGYGLGAGEVRP